jgi:hypothetical protein
VQNLARSAAFQGCVTPPGARGRTRPHRRFCHGMLEIRSRGSPPDGSSVNDYPRHAMPNKPVQSRLRLCRDVRRCLYRGAERGERSSGRAAPDEDERSSGRAAWRTSGGGDDRGVRTDVSCSTVIVTQGQTPRCLCSYFSVNTGVITR